MLEPYLTDYVRRRLAQKGISVEAVDLVCNAYSDHEYDEINDSFELRGMVTGGLLEVCNGNVVLPPQKGREDGMLVATVGRVRVEVLSDGVCLD